MSTQYEFVYEAGFRYMRTYIIALRRYVNGKEQALDDIRTWLMDERMKLDMTVRREKWKDDYALEDIVQDAISKDVIDDDNDDIKHLLLRFADVIEGLTNRTWNRMTWQDRNGPQKSLDLVDFMQAAAIVYAEGKPDEARG